MEQRKIEGWIDGEPTQPPDPQTGFIASLMGSEANDGSSIPATLIIGGKGFTHDEVKAMYAWLWVEDKTPLIDQDNRSGPVLVRLEGGRRIVAQYEINAVGSSWVVPFGHNGWTFFETRNSHWMYLPNDPE